MKAVLLRPYLNLRRKVRFRGLFTWSLSDCLTETKLKAKGVRETCAEFVDNVRNN